MVRLSILAIAALMAVPALAQEPVKKPATFEEIYAPMGFDSNDNVQFVGEGMFRNTCYRPAETGVRIDQDKKTITVGPVAYEYAGFCLQVILPFERVVDVGLLKPGKYTVLQQPDNKVLGVIPVSATRTDSPDDFLYAPIDQAFFRQKGLQSEIYLTGNFMTNCMSLEDVKVSVEPKAIVVQPIVKVEERDGCLRGKFPFNKTVKVELVPKGRYLLHVRSMNAKAINTLVDVQ